MIYTTSSAVRMVRSRVTASQGLDWTALSAKLSRKRLFPEAALAGNFHQEQRNYAEIDGLLSGQCDLRSAISRVGWLDGGGLVTTAS